VPFLFLVLAGSVPADCLVISLPCSQPIFSQFDGRQNDQIRGFDEHRYLMQAGYHPTPMSPLFGAPLGGSDDL
jgi:hypothetical protein